MWSRRGRDFEVISAGVVVGEEFPGNRLLRRSRADDVALRISRLLWRWRSLKLIVILIIMAALWSSLALVASTPAKLRAVGRSQRSLCRRWRDNLILA